MEPSRLTSQSAGRVVLGVADGEANAFPVRSKSWAEDRSACPKDFADRCSARAGKVENRTFAEYELLAVGRPGCIASRESADALRRSGADGQSPEFIVGRPALHGCNKKLGVIRRQIERLQVPERARNQRAAGFRQRYFSDDALRRGHFCDVKLRVVGQQVSLAEAIVRHLRDGSDSRGGTEAAPRARTDNTPATAINPINVTIARNRAIRRATILFRTECSCAHVSNNIGPGRAGTLARRLRG